MQKFLMRTAAVVAAALLAAAPAAHAGAARGTGAHRATGVPTKARISYGQVGSRLVITTTAPIGTTALQVQRKQGKKWVHSSSEIGSITEVKQVSGKLAVTAKAKLVWGSRQFRIAGTHQGAPVASSPIKLTGFKWMPLLRAFDVPQSDEMIPILGSAYPFLGDLKTVDAYFDHTDSDTATSGNVVCRKVDAGIHFGDVVASGTADYEFSTQNGLYKKVSTTKASGDVVPTISLDGSPFTLTTNWDHITMVTGTPGDSTRAVTWAARGWCSGAQR